MKNLTLVTLAVLQGISMAHAEPIDNTSPAINPQRECMTEGMINPPDKNFRYLFSNDCRVVHVIPPETIKQEIKAEGMGLRACEGVALLEDTIITLETMRKEAIDRSRKYKNDAANATGKEARALLAKAEEENAAAKKLGLDAEESQKRLADTYGRTPGAKFAVILKSDIDARDLNELRGLNLANLQRKKIVEVHKTDANGKPVIETHEEIELSTLRPAKLNQSVFSFIYKKPSDVGSTGGGLLSTNIPGLQYLESPGQEGVLHVRASGGITGEVVMNLPLACEHLKKDQFGKVIKDATGRPFLDNETDPFFIVNRTFSVQQMFAQGYTAELRVDKVVEQITKSVITNTEQGFKKSVVFNPAINADVDQIVDFQWQEGWDSEKSVKMDQVLEIKKAVTAKLIDDYIEKLKTAGIIEMKKDPNTEAAPGGYVDEARTANRCWTESDGGLSGLLGRRHTVCGDYTYTVKVWRDGITNEEITRNLTLNGRTVDSMRIYNMAPFSYTTAFQK